MIIYNTMYLLVCLGRGLLKV